MINRTLPYGDTTVEVSLPDRTRFPSRDLRSGLQPVADQAEAVRDALSAPLGLPRVRELVRPGGRVLIAFDDPTVPSFGPVRRLVVETILAELAEAGVPEENVNLVCANALPRKWAA